MVAMSRSLTVYHAPKASGSLSTVTLRRVHSVGRVRRNASDIDARAALLFRTSGITGTGKMISVTHANLLKMANKMRRWFDLSDEVGASAFFVDPLDPGLQIRHPRSTIAAVSTVLPMNRNTSDAYANCSGTAQLPR